MKTRLRRAESQRSRFYDDVRITGLVQTCCGCPSQWNAVGPDGEIIYIRFRHGHFRVDVNDETEFDCYPENRGGVMSTEEMLELTGFVANSYTGTNEEES